MQVKKFTVAELAQKYEVQNRIVQGWIERGKFPHAERQGRRFFVPEADLDGFTPQRKRGRPPLAHPSKRSIYTRNLRAFKKQAALTGEAELEPFFRSKKIDEKLDEMCRLYRDEKWNLLQIAGHLKISQKTIAARLLKSGIKIRPRVKRYRYLDRKTLLRLYIDEKRGMIKVAEILGCPQAAFNRKARLHRISKTICCKNTALEQHGIKGNGDFLNQENGLI